MLPTFPLKFYFQTSINIKCAEIPLIFRSLPAVVMTDDECLDVMCGENAECLNTEGTYSCQCKSGFTGDGYSNCTGESRVCWIVRVCVGLFWLGV